MWQRKSPEELKEEERKKSRHRKNPTLPIVIAVFGALISLLGDLFDARRFGVPRLWFFVFSFILLFVVSYIGQYFFDNAVVLVTWLISGGGLVGERTQICSLCHDVKRPDKTKICHCGGTFEPLEHWKWVND
jgi:hypothetical protein